MTSNASIVVFILFGSYLFPTRNSWRNSVSDPSGAGAP